MTTARTATVYIETAAVPVLKARTATLYAEIVSQPVIKARTATLYVEVVVGELPVAAGGWAVGMIRIV